MDLSRLIGAGKYLKMLAQLSTRTTWPGGTLTPDVWIEALSLTGKHRIDLLAFSGTAMFAKYVVDGVESTERFGSAQMSFIIGLGIDNVRTDISLSADSTVYAKDSFKVFVKRPASAATAMTFECRYSQVSVEPME